MPSNAPGATPGSARYSYPPFCQQLQSPVGIVPFVGAGLSVPFGYPGWRNFLIEIAKKVDIEKLISELLVAGQHEEAAEALISARGRSDIENAYGDHKLKGKSLQGAVSYLPCLSTGPVVTTNFDHVLEKAFEQAGSHFEYVIWGSKADITNKALTQSLRVLLKIHGDVTDRTDRVLTKSEYEAVYGSSDGPNIDPSMPLSKVLRTILASRPVLFVGCSLNQDRTVRVLKHVVQNFESVEHYAVVEQVSSRSEFLARNRFLSDHNIHPIYYPKGRYSLVETLLSYLADERRGGIGPIASLPDYRVSRRKEIKKAIVQLLDENHRIFLDYGPSSARSNNPVVPEAKMWSELCIETIVPNNNRIVALLRDNRSLLGRKERDTADRFERHAREFAFNHLSGDKYENAARFPVEIYTILD